MQMVFGQKRNPTTSPRWVGEEGDSITPAGAGKEGGSPQVTAQRTWGVDFLGPFLALSPTVLFRLEGPDRKKTSGFTHHKRKRVLASEHSPSGAAAFANRVPPLLLSAFGKGPGPES